MTKLRKGVSPTFDGERDTTNNSAKESTDKKHTTLADGKTKEIVKLFASGRRLSCLDHHWTGDSCLHSTVSYLSRRYGLSIPRKWARLPNRSGVLTHVKLYWFSVEDVTKMLLLIVDETPIIRD